jgi:hypothetical protein
VEASRTRMFYFLWVLTGEMCWETALWDRAN